MQLDKAATPLILVVDDESVNRLILESNLKKFELRTISASSGQECLELARREKPDLILLDIIMPEMDGFETCLALKSEQESRDIPVIFLSALTDSSIKTKGFEAGGVDYVSKPFDSRELLARVRTHLTLRNQEKQLRLYSETLEDMVDERTNKLKSAEKELQRNYEMQTALNQLLQLSLQELPLENLLQQCLESILETSWLALQNRGCIFLQEEAGTRYNMSAHSNLPPIILDRCASILPGECACGKAIEEQEIIVVPDDAPAHKAPASLMPDPHSHICVPIRSKDSTVALMNLYADKGRGLTQQDLVFLKAVGRTLAQIILYKRTEQRIFHHVYHEPLTNLPNRAALLDRLNKEIEKLRSVPDYKFSLILANLDRFNRFNESLGYDLGDKLILSSAQRILVNRKAEEEVLHLGGDGFAVLMKDLSEPVAPLLLAEKILEALKQPHHLDDQELQTTASAGVVLSNTGYERAEDVLRDADIALHQAKNKGRGRFEVFNCLMHQKARQTMQMFMDLRLALQRNEFVLFYQPIICLSSGRAEGVEALIRWFHPAQGMVSPGEFIPLAEETGLILPIGRWVLERACLDMLQFAEDLGFSEPMMVSVNLSAKQFAQKDLFEQVEAILECTGFPPQCLKLEITESVIMENAEAAVRILDRLKKLGIKISIDDFGTGYSSLSYLNRFSADILKVDRSFVSRMHLGGENLEIVRTIVTLAQAMKMMVIAEGVETKEEMDALIALKCEYAQGYYFAKPMPLDQLRGSQMFGESEDRRGLTADRRGKLPDRRASNGRRASDYCKET
ncbi:EAL domain-containing protein [Desulfonatronum parangueonense]